MTPNLFKKNKPVIRPFEPIHDDTAGDVAYLWDAYKKGWLEHTEEGMNMEQFIKYVDKGLLNVQEAWVVEDYVRDNLVPIGFVIGRNNGWLLEPHVNYFKNASSKNILRTYVAFLKKTKYRKDIGSCLVRVPEASKNLANRVERYGLLEYVGKIWNGSPTGNEYLYTVRCKRQPDRSH
jgi:hypothetical protein